MATVEALDVEAARARFAALARPSCRLLDGPGGSQVPREVVDAIAGYLVERNANLGGAFAASRESDAVDARRAPGGGGLRRRDAGRDRVRRRT